MKRIVKMSDWQVECGKSSKNGTLSELIKSLGRGDVEITDDDGQVIDLSPPPIEITVARRVELERDRAGRIIVKSVEPEQAQVEPRGEIDMERFRGQMKIAESFKDEDRQKAIKAIYLEHLGVEI